ncbi:unnamed protein product [Gongylonema pulchrum]|uniref:DAZ-associated protein 2 n=1 Tax=Gongylonema pulchrum TaxID=637853 RepID=A0A183EV70_9BILA|nr:unnamed protein product [Gongylonema pulchrum]
MQGVGLYVPAGPAQPYTQQLMSQYQVPYFGPYPPQLSMGASASMPPPPVPPPTTNAVITAPPPFQLIQVTPEEMSYICSAADGQMQCQAEEPGQNCTGLTQTHQQVAGYPRQFYQGDQSVVRNHFFTKGILV